jgi:hypothetical protein
MMCPVKLASEMSVLCVYSPDPTLEYRRAATPDRVAALLLKEFNHCGLEFKSARNLDDTIQATAADGVRRSDLTESWTVDIEDGVAGPV